MQSTAQQAVNNADVVSLSLLKVDLEAFLKLDGAVRLYEKDAAQRLAGLQQVQDALRYYLGDSDNAFRNALKSYANEVSPHISTVISAFDAHRVQNRVTPETLTQLDETLRDMQVYAHNLASIWSTISAAKGRIVTAESRPSATSATTISDQQRIIDENNRKYTESLDNIRTLLNSFEQVLSASSSSSTPSTAFVTVKRLLDNNTARPIDQSYTADITTALKRLENEGRSVRSKLAEKMDPKKATGFNDFLALARSSSTPSLVDKAALAGVDKVSLATLYGQLGKLLVDEVVAGIAIMKRLAKVPMPGLYADSLKTIITQMIELSDKHSSSGLMYGINGPVKTLPVLISSLSSLLVQLPKDPSASSATAKTSANATPPFAGSLLYRTLDPARAVKYKLQIERFFNTYEKETLATSVITQAARLKNVRKELAKRAADLKARQGPEADSADTSFAVLTGQLRQLRRQHFEACKSFVRAVRNFVSIFVTRVLNFVRYQHGDAIAYMNYWTNATDLPTEHMDNIKRHNQICRDITEQVQKTISEDVIKKTQSELYATDIDGAITLDQDDQYVLYELNTRFADWAQEQSARVNDAFLTGPPSTIEEFMEPHQIILYSLKLLRVGAAAIAIAAAERLFQAVYRKRVYVYDEDPPNLAWFLGLILLIDLAIHVGVAIILAIVMSIFARPNNTFPINRDLMAMWAFDYVASTVPIALILLSTSTVLRFKKYFRYKYEGQRAIRAMAKIAFYTYVVVLPIPFYRMMYG